MPDINVPSGQIGSGTFNLVANQVSTITFVDNIGAVEIMWDGSADVWYTTDGTTPTTSGVNCYRLPAGITGSDVRATTNTQAGTDVVKLVSTSAPVVSVQRA